MDADIGAIFFASYGAVLVAEVAGDKLLYTTGVLTTCYRTAPVVGGVTIAFMGKMAVAVLIGRSLSEIPAAWIAALTAFGFVGVAWSILRGPDVRATTRGGFRAGLVAFAAIFLSEWGDVGQLTAAALAARFPAPFTVWLGAVLAMVTKGVIVASIGARVREWARGRIAPGPLRYGGFALLLLLGALSVIEVLEPGR